MFKPDTKIPSEADLARIEILGDNCEIATVIEAAGYKKGGLLKWARSTPEAVLKGLKDDFYHLYDYDLLESVWGTMVMHIDYGIAFHSDMKSELYTIDGIDVSRFTQSDDERKFVHQIESRKVEYLKKGFFGRASQDGTIYVIKSTFGIDPNIGINKNVMRSIEKELERITFGRRFLLLEIRETKDKNNHGKLKMMSHRRAVGYIREFAGYGTATTIVDPDGWMHVIEKALRLTPVKHRTILSDFAERIINLINPIH